MHILITGADSVIGQTAAARLAAAGHRVVGVVQRTPSGLDRRVEWVRAGLEAAALQRLANSADAVLHLAPIEPDVPHSAGIAGVVQVSHVAARAGARLLFVSQAAGDPALYRQAEELVASSWTPSLIIRVAALVSRQRDWMVDRTAAAIGSADVDTRVRVLHTDDLHRFLLRSIGSHRTGTVDLGTEPVPASSARRWLDGAGRRRRRGPAWPVLHAPLDTGALRNEWDFSLGWGAAEALADMGRTVVAGPVIPVAEVVTPSPGARASTHSGEFDDTIAAAFPMFSAWGTSDALPGPLTPMTIDVQGRGLRAAHRVTSEILGLRGELAGEWQHRSTAVFGHRLFTGVSVSEAVAATVPQAMRRPAVIARLSQVSRHYTRWCDDHSRLPGHAGGSWSGTTDAGLDTRLLLLRDRIAQGWTLASMGSLVENLLLRLVDRDLAGIPSPSEMTATPHLAQATALLAAELRRNPRLREIAKSGDLGALRTESPSAAASIAAAIGRVGHRGPGEAELANPVTADSPSQLLAAAALAVEVEPERVVVQGRRGLPTPLRRAEEIRRARELVWDVTMRNTHELRTALRAKGARLTASRRLAAAEDIWYLTLDEVVSPPIGTRLVVERRRAERERLQALSMPQTISVRWVPLPVADDDVEVGDVPVNGVAANGAAAHVTELEPQVQGQAQTLEPQVQA
ncbi:NAD-dependent epimerase/dehydratase family protein [Mycolicibacterium confluentis]|uniref:NAD-dependent epimerase/dehydratase domain-containing protein n=1 Tax=Mycolicibacterium confluentis TaxID=28047 RepID=A0A7I7XW21_9MYCO|nr:NAD-dependent epimerase/dehydratase family protein [Mycolicibacterium confluentis]MCV7321694.1 NAD-dependent epimerase/dehydratase family protein [Mycolicibacterium confluentis]BBZ33505.1 hypothetical protein MCNF_21100 [Mycolicibacterium confluentis]